MKAEAPKKIYIDQYPFKDEYEEYWYSSPSGDKSVEYIRKDIVNSMLEMAIHPTKSEVRRDVFIDKACEWLENHNDYQRVLDNGKGVRFDMTQCVIDFRKAMKRE